VTYPAYPWTPINIENKALVGYSERFSCYVPADGHTCLIASYQDIGKALMSLPHVINLIGATAELTEDLSLAIDEPADVKYTGSSNIHSHAAVSNSGISTPGIQQGTDPLFGETGTTLQATYGNSWAAGDWPTIPAQLVAKFLLTRSTGWVGPSDFNTGDPYWFRWLLTGSPGPIDPSSIFCQKPYWWDALWADDPAAASARMLAFVNFWITSNGSSFSAVWLEDLLSLPSDWPRLHLLFPPDTTVDGQTSIFRVPQDVTGPHQLHLTLDVKAADYPCVDECLPGFADVVTSVQAIAATLISGSDTVASLLVDMRKTIKAFSSLETSLQTSKDGVYISNKSGPSS
jgi:hypothetical protein